MKKLLATTVLSGVLLAPAAVMAPAALADDTPSAPITTQSEAQNQLKKIDASIAELQEAEKVAAAATKPDTDYLKEIRELLATAFELRETITAIAAGGVPKFDFATIGPRVELLTTISSTVETASTDLTNKVSEAHVEIGFAVTKAVIRLGNPTSTVDQIKDSIKDLKDTVAKVSNYPDLGPEDRATIYVKAKLDKAIWEVRLERDKNILGKNSDAYWELNKAIMKAVGVQLDPTATVAQTEKAAKDVKAAYEAAAAKVA